ncbi:hypothetical protein MGSAQ_002544 [marine sediment metagenome]|uniref:Uncharacterized protein n=1 Tax=marine sediment metagenome TaxID=412755 RepID=A0A1B6NR80_9ZZZZ
MSSTNITLLLFGTTDSISLLSDCSKAVLEIGSLTSKVLP